ncbi:hypothetical protein [Nocardioides pinisoli]|uniref:Uncharacterized protein n=1 Tax=Nocardioides pinisoli TaxID=2950279 RepID=A0ABT1L104_9ACTN|nr:hypothetical protein [Nocardioides pinisoli]MCP3423690.1 hypothetical protein [Nocardioides pinisoli]
MKLLAPAVLLACLAVAGCSGDAHADYCEAVEDHQADLSEVAASDDAGAVFDALDDYEALAEEAPRDIADDWAAVVGPLRTLEEVLAAHDVDPSTYIAEEPPAGLGSDARKDIEAAARAVGSRRTVEAMSAVEQHALDVCGTPLSR